MPTHSISSSDSDSSDESVERQPRANTSQNDEFSLKNTIDFELDMKPLEADSALITTEEIESDAYETWLVTVPSKVDPHSLLNQNLPFQFKSKITVNNMHYETNIHKKNAPITLIIPDKQGYLKMTSKEIQGTVQVLEDVAVPEISEDALISKKPAPVPGTFKRRHPIYGNDLESIVSKGQTSSPERRVKKKRKSAVAND